MRLPFLQLESDFLAHGGAEVAALARCTLVQAIGHVALLRAWAVSHATDESPPDGRVVGEAAGRRIEAAAQWAGERGALLQALVDAGQVAQVPEGDDAGYRILHLEPYQTAWERNAKAKARMANRRERGANGREQSANTRELSANEVRTDANAPRATSERSAKFVRQTQMQTQMQMQREASAASQQGPGSAPPGVAAEVEAYVESGLREQDDGMPMTQPPLVDVPPAPARTPRASSPRASPPPKTTEEEREARKLVEEVHERVLGKPYRWEAEDWTALRTCLSPSCSGSDLHALEHVWEYGLKLGSEWPGCMRLRALASQWTQLEDHERKASTLPDNPRLQRQQVGGDVPRIPQVARMYSGQG